MCTCVLVALQLFWPPGLWYSRRDCLPDCLWNWVLHRTEGLQSHSCSPEFVSFDLFIHFHISVINLHPLGGWSWLRMAWENHFHLHLVKKSWSHMSWKSWGLKNFFDLNLVKKSWSCAGARGGGRRDQLQDRADDQVPRRHRGLRHQARVRRGQFQTLESRLSLLMQWPVERCTLERKLVKKYTPETACYKEPRELCAPRGCGFRNVRKTFMKWEMNFWFSGYGWVPRQGEDNRSRQPLGDLRDRAPENLQARDQARAQARRCGGVCRRAQGGHFHFSICQLSCVPKGITFTFQYASCYMCSKMSFHFSIC